jgi:hypothetical protein
LKKICVAYPQEDFLFIKLKTCFRISLLKNCKRLPVPYYTKYKICVIRLIWIKSFWALMTSGCISEFRIKFLIDGLITMDLDTTYKNFMTNKFRFLGSHNSRCISDPKKHTFSDPTKGEVSNLKAFFKKRAYKIFHLKSMKY